MKLIVFLHKMQFQYPISLYLLLRMLSCVRVDTFVACINAVKWIERSGTLNQKHGHGHGHTHVHLRMNHSCGRTWRKQPKVWYVHINIRYTIVRIDRQTEVLTGGINSFLDIKSSYWIALIYLLTITCVEYWGTIALIEYKTFI